ncbi:NusG domain II-containing protein [uncultured Clostridium sp.]|uniref:NusG domain II-containing protein n=1 Tax=uncultured Clostridium sp. TaxID=59620 RepID=UPI002591F447|nr:NusG domain II-containing protein [uncultured Clostridium sp.]
MFKKLDIVIIIVLIIISFVPEIVFGMVMGYKYDMTYAEITVEGKVYSKIPLSAHKGKEVIDINIDGHENKIVIKDDTIRMIDADCPDSLCIYQGKISRVGQSLVCLPNKVMIEIKGNFVDDDDVILSH